MSTSAVSAADLDLVMADGDDVAARLLDLLVATLSGDHQPRHQLNGNEDFQVTRGLLGVSF